ncbi:MAG TPA: hypothetical protein PK283_08475 [Thiotrichales bacterium]|nr:hypothetical protein [Thiotrichales bacterium]
MKTTEKNEYPLKQVRQWSTEKYHHDSALDSVAYAALLAESLYSKSTT